jgi:hypothetical protein
VTIERAQVDCVDAGQRTHRYQYRAAIAAPIVGENSIGMRFSWRSFRAAINQQLINSSGAGYFVSISHL